MKLVLGSPPHILLVNSSPFPALFFSLDLKAISMPSPSGHSRKQPIQPCLIKAVGTKCVASGVFVLNGENRA